MNYIHTYLHSERHIANLCHVCIFLLLGLTCCNTGFDEIEIKKQLQGPEEGTIQKDTVTSQSQVDSLGGNLLENGGLEAWENFITPDMPKGWHLPSNEYVKRNNKIVYEGKLSAKMQSEETGKTARLAQLISVYPNHTIRIRFHYYVEKWKTKGARTYCYFRTEAAEKYNISAEDLQAFYGKDTYYVIRGGGLGQTYLPNKLNTWQIFDETIQVPPTANYFMFGINSYCGSTIYVDDCYIFDVTGK